MSTNNPTHAQAADMVADYLPEYMATWIAGVLRETHTLPAPDPPPGPAGAGRARHRRVRRDGVASEAWWVWVFSCSGGGTDMSEQRAILKYPLGEYPGPCTQAIPKEARFVHVGQQHGIVTVWAEVPCPVVGLRTVTLRVTATGEPFEGEYLGTVQMPNGLVWHVVRQEPA
jgi:hypothetical protein